MPGDTALSLPGALAWPRSLKDRYLRTRENALEIKDNSFCTVIKSSPVGSVDMGREYYALFECGTVGWILHADLYNFSREPPP